MNIVSPSAVSYSKNLSFEFSNTLRNDNVDMSDYAYAQYIIDVDGKIYQSAPANEQDASIVLIGGVDAFINEKAIRPQSNFYITQQQKNTLYKIMKEHATYYSDAEVTGNTDSLDQCVSALYNNLVG